jgi:hypothetical protein
VARRLKCLSMGHGMIPGPSGPVLFAFATGPERALARVMLRFDATLTAARCQIYSASLDTNHP